MNPEKLFCTVLEKQYDSTVMLVENALLFFPNYLRILKSNVRYFEKFVLDTVESELDVIEKKMLSWFDLIKIESLDRNKDRKFDFCEVAYRCLALRQTMFPSNGNDPAWVTSIPLNVRNSFRVGSGSYDTYEKYVCKLSFRKMLSDFIDSLVSELEAMIRDISNKLIANKLDEWIEDYFLALARLGIYDLLDTLDAYAQCGFGICNFIQTSVNYREDVEDRTLSTKTGNGWQFKSNQYINSIYLREEKIKQKIDYLSQKINTFKTDKTNGSNVKTDEIMKG